MRSNPAYDYFVVELTSPENIICQDYAVRIHSMDGKKVDQYILNKSKSHHILPTGSLNNGTYLCIFVADNKIIEQKKLTILISKCYNPFDTWSAGTTIIEKGDGYIGVAISTNPTNE